MKEVDKLIRDNIPEILDKKWIPYEIWYTNNENKKEYIKRKIQEEINELLESESIEEVADTLEILRKFCEIMWYSQDEVEKIRQQKNKERGWFKKWIILKKLWE